MSAGEEEAEKEEEEEEEEKNESKSEVWLSFESDGISWEDREDEVEISESALSLSLELSWDVTEDEVEISESPPKLLSSGISCDDKEEEDVISESPPLSLGSWSDEVYEVDISESSSESFPPSTNAFIALLSPSSFVSNTQYQLSDP